MFVFRKGLLDKAMQGPVLIVPFEADADIFAPCPVNSDVIPLLERLFQVCGMFVSFEFDFKIINYLE